MGVIKQISDMCVLLPCETNDHEKEEQQHGIRSLTDRGSVDAHFHHCRALQGERGRRGWGDDGERK